MKRIFFLVVAAVLLAGCKQTDSTVSLQEAYRDYWRMGVSVNQWEVQAEQQRDSRFDYTGAFSTDQTADFPLIVHHFGWLVPENCMKSEVIHPREDVYDFTLADQLVDKALASGCHVVGHCLIWHSQCAPWFFVDDEGRRVGPDVLKARMKAHITAVLDHFRGRVEAWDVVNEAFNDDGTLRRSPFYEILGDEFIPLAFQYAHEADPTVELYYNDYSMNKARKVEAVADFFRPLLAKGLPLTAIGMQGHLVYGDTDYITQYDHAIATITALGVKAQFTELDLSMLPNPYGFTGANVSDNFGYSRQMDPYADGLPAEKQQAADEFWLDFFRMLLRHRDDVLRVGFWCFNDANSWRNDFPIHGRTDYATLFDRQGRPKPTVEKLTKLVRLAK